MSSPGLLFWSPSVPSGSATPVTSVIWSETSATVVPELDALTYSGAFGIRAHRTT